MCNLTMLAIDSKAIEELTVRLCAIPSVSGQAEKENACADFIAEELKGINLKHGHTLTVSTVPCEGDKLGRKAVLALLKTAKTTSRTVLLTGHFDVVDTDVCGDLAQVAFDLKRFTEVIGTRQLLAEARKDYETGNWLFGRGSMDMKAGLAIFIKTIEGYAASPDLNVNLVFWAVPDEEANSAGMRGSLHAFCELVQREKLSVVAGLTGEPCFWTTATKNALSVRPYCTGTTGKIMPIFMAVGREAHIGDYFSGLNAALMISDVVSEVEGSIDFVDGYAGEKLTPPACLSLEVRRDVYSVTLPERACAYFNLLTVTKTPAEVLSDCCKVAERAMQKTLARLNKNTEAYFGEPGHSFESIPVITVGDVIAMSNRSQSDVLSELSAFCNALPATLDAREIAIRSLEKLLGDVKFKGPAVIVGFVPPYYPSRINRNRTENERLLRTVIEQAAQKAGAMAGDGATTTIEVFGGISDLSFLGFDGDPKDLRSIESNMLGWGSVYSLPIDDLLKLDIPVANMGPAGKDAHKLTERLERRFSFEIAPKLLVETIEKLA